MKSDMFYSEYTIRQLSCVAKKGTKQGSEVQKRCLSLIERFDVPYRKPVDNVIFDCLTSLTARLVIYSPRVGFEGGQGGSDDSMADLCMA